MLVNVTLFVFVLVLCSMCCSLRVCRVCVRTPQISRLRRLSSTLDAGVPLVMEYKLLSNMIVAQGAVCRGYGRGSKKLGFPTANLPQFDKELRELSIGRGIYFGWAMVADESQVFPCVTNIGISPTFVGQENAANIVETYLIDRPVERGDFYGKLLRLALVGYIRPELKFDSLLSLVAQIEKDVNISRKVCSTLSNGSAGVGVDSKAVGTDMRELYKCTVLPRLKHTNQRTGNYLFLCDYDTSGTS